MLQSLPYIFWRSRNSCSIWNFRSSSGASDQSVASNLEIPAFSTSGFSVSRKRVYSLRTTKQTWAAETSGSFVGLEEMGTSGPCTMPFHLEAFLSRGRRSVPLLTLFWWVARLPDLDTNLLPVVAICETSVDQMREGKYWCEAMLRATDRLSMRTSLSPNSLRISYMLFRRKEHVCALEATRSFWRLLYLTVSLLLFLRWTLKWVYSF
jgi:hypothetical protein